MLFPPRNWVVVVLSDSLGLWTCIAFFQEGHMSIKQMLPPASIPQISLLFIVIGVLGSGDGLRVIRLTGTCARLLCHLLTLQLLL